MEKSFDELVTLKQAGKLTMKEFIQQSEYADDFREWLLERGETATDDNAEKFFEEIDKEFEYSQNENLEGNYGV